MELKHVTLEIQPPSEWIMSHTSFLDISEQVVFVAQFGN
jgi:hypothetical protein